MANIPQTREELVALIDQRRSEMTSAGRFHRRDLAKNIKRLERELRDYDRYHREAKDSASADADGR